MEKIIIRIINNLFIFIDSFSEYKTPLGTKMTDQFVDYYDREFANQLSGKFNIADSEVLLQKLNQCGVKYQKMLAKKNHI